MSRTTVVPPAILAAERRAAAAGSPAAICDLAERRCAAGDLTVARDLLVGLLERQPDYAAAYVPLARVLLAAGHVQDAAACLRQALASSTDCLPAIRGLATERRALGDLRGALHCCRALLAQHAGDPAALNELGLVLSTLGELAAAETAWREVIRQAPGLAEPHANLAALKQQAGDLEAALNHYRAAAHCNPDWPELWNNLGVVLRGLGDAVDAMDAFRAALRLRPDFAAASYNLGNALQDLGETAPAGQAYRHALALEPGHAEAHYGLALCVSEPAAATTHLERALALRPDFPEAVVALALARLRACDWTGVDVLRERIEGMVRERPDAPVSPFSFLQLSADAQLQQLCARNWSAHRVRPLAQLPLAEARPRQRLRVGYLSGDFGNHAVGHLVADLFAAHDRSRFEVLGYGSAPHDGSELAARIRASFDRFLDVQRLGDAALAQRLRADAVDILVDLSGYTQSSRTRVLTARPAPVQVSYLGFPGTLGAPFADYLVGDAFVTPPHLAEWYDERLMRLPLCYLPSPTVQAHDAPRPARAALGLPQDGVVLCCFNNSFKIRPEMFQVWMRLLRETPGAVLWLAAFSAAAQENLRAEARRCGVDPGRLVFAPIVGLQEHAQRLPAADLFLDTHPYSAGATAQQTLSAGVPLLTLAGTAYVSRMAGSMLNALGLRELIAESLADYADRAHALIRDPVRLQDLRARLFAAAGQTRLFHARTAARALEEAYLAAWEAARARATGSVR
jgi:protein O-GlcNAc transferase